MALGDQIHKRFQTGEFSALAEPDLSRCQLLMQALHAGMPPRHIT
ncbi:hypothetical protein ALQ33_200010 [Pseudomonas syringae pv. philadelphi]|uniref:Uncharacterized protein n=1 Tax=Pseudomonas syringae pv. philadelphi TaxID=251706 RepID=A0A3M3Y8Q9_9PSED|nr:hypothetical protein ALQ33_200010 [Pseudomonas syringae pv. philadelphi]